LEKCLSQVKLVPEADPGISCPIPLPEKYRPVLMAAVTARADCLVTGDPIHFGPFSSMFAGKLTTSVNGKLRVCHLWECWECEKEDTEQVVNF